MELDQMVSTSNLSPTQIKAWSKLCAQVSAGEITMNQAYKKACDENYMKQWSNNTGDSAVADSAYKGSFTDWMTTAQEQGWIDSILNIGAGIHEASQEDGEIVYRGGGSKTNGSSSDSKDDEKANLTWLWVTLGVVAVAGITIAVARRRQNN